jgi:hypothetical protein
MIKRRKLNPTTKQKDLMKKSEERLKALALASVDVALMDQTNDYVMRGRHFARLDSYELNEIWAAAFKKRFTPLTKAAQYCEFADAWAELRLRGAELPLHLVPAEHEKLQKIIRSINHDAPFPEIDRINEKFIEDLNKPKN